MIDNRPPIDATGGAAVRKPGRTLLLSPGRRILMEKEVITPPGGGGGGLRKKYIGSTKVPRFDGTTSWEQYHQVWEQYH